LPYDGLENHLHVRRRSRHSHPTSSPWFDPEVYAAQVAAARTFTIYEDIEKLIKMGKIKGGSLDCAVVIKGDKIISKEPLRLCRRIRPAQDS